MASVFQKQGKWWLKFKDAHGKWRIIPTTLDTKTGAVRLARDLEQKAERQRLGLEPMPVVENITFGELMNRWWGEHGPLLRSKTIQPFAKRHLEPVLGNKLLREISAGQLEILFNELRQSLSPQSCNHLRSYIRRAFAYASRRGLWRGDNPAAALKKQRIPKKKPEYLRPDEVAAVLERVPAKWQPLFATAFFTGMRKGELLGLKKADLDLRNGTITVRRSNNFDTTKGSHEDELPIANELRSFLVTALKASPPTSEFVFCRPDGRQYPADVQLQRVLRYAMGQAGIVIGYQHVCRRKGCGHQERREDASSTRCPRCNMKLWVNPIPRPLRFHDTRHTTAALLLKAQVPLAVVQKVLRHTDPAITANVYGNIGLEDLRAAVNVLGDKVRSHLRVVPDEPPEEPAHGGTRRS